MVCPVALLVSLFSLFEFCNHAIIYESGHMSIDSVIDSYGRGNRYQNQGLLYVIRWYIRSNQKWKKRFYNWILHIACLAGFMLLPCDANISM